MIDIKNKVDCCGCQACGDICPKEAISFHVDEEGIWYPKVELKNCIDCHLCEKVCPIINHVSNPDNSVSPITYILQSPNPIDRLNSASGAAYTLLVREVFKKGGYVAGHIWENKSSVKGYISYTPEDIPLLQSTKYLQSNVEGLYKAVKNLLTQGKYVLFSGCPCQNAALRSYLRKDYENLVMTDFTCMGIDSPLAFKKYIESLENQFHSKMVFFKAKSKEVGWRFLTNKAIFENGKTYFGVNGRDANLKATFLDILVRPSCYDCKYKGFPRVSDITIGDYWRKKYDYDPLDDNTGTSYVMLHNQKAEMLFERVLPECNYRKIEFSEILKANPFAIKSLPYPKFDRLQFYNRMHEKDFGFLVDDYYRNSIMPLNAFQKVKRIGKFIISSAFYNRKHPVSFFKMLYYNLFSSKIKSNLINGDILVLRDVKLKICRNSRVEVKGLCVLDGDNCQIAIELGDKASMYLDNNLIESGCNILIGSNSSLSLGFRTIINEAVCITSTSNIVIGEFCLIDKGVDMNDTDGDIILFDGTRYDKKTISIGTHTLIGRNTIVKGGTVVGDETIVLENSSLKGEYNSRIVLSGIPAMIINNNINWKHNFDFTWNYKS